MFMFIIIGLLAGLLATYVLKDHGDSLARNLVIGIAGAFFGSFLFEIFDWLFIEIIMSTLFAFLSAIAAIWLVARMEPRKKDPLDRF